MYKFIRANKIGYYDGVCDKLRDIENNVVRKIKSIDDKGVISKMYDIGYKKGYESIKDIYGYKFFRNVKRK